uniref:Uncharacterized protein n=1 Tax=Arundo donax TaxID=35708 RepID=A0A0A8XRY2_ARUDO
MHHHLDLRTYVSRYPMSLWHTCMDTYMYRSSLLRATYVVRMATRRWRSACSRTP